MNGARASRARRRAISVLPTPVGPIIRMFFGVISARSALVDLHAAPAIAQRDRDGALGRALPDDVLVEFLDDFSGVMDMDSVANRVTRSSSIVRLRFV